MQEIKTLVFATNNLHKLEEMQQIVRGKVRLLSLADIGCREDIPETADTFEGNALLKARFVKERYGYDCFADDSGLEVEALDYAPGVYSARYAGVEHDSRANMDKLLSLMLGKSNRRARFRTVIALVVADGREYTFEGIINGVITEEKKGSGGFGYDPVFLPDGYNQTFAEMTDDVKNNISHRALAGRELLKFLSNYNTQKE
ncbi:MAG: non-canonical purine NTP diphosphatase [Tannerellaceae bacterium]|jgi:XTP/dITP diphosphohydrolase|nr:non-canonical purine NTP diphosphatase [Tannerellaceae bacterium]